MYLEPLSSVRDHHRNPPELPLGVSTLPHQAEAEHVLVEGIDAIGIVNPVADVKRFAREASGREELAGVAAVHRTRKELDELHVLSLWIFDDEAQVSVGIGVDDRRHGHPTAREVGPQRAGVGGLEAHIPQPAVGFRLEIRRDVHVLPLVDLERGEPVAAERVRRLERLIESENRRVEAACRRHVLRPEGDARDAGNCRTGRRGLRPHRSDPAIGRQRQQQTGGPCEQPSRVFHEHTLLSARIRSVLAPGAPTAADTSTNDDRCRRLVGVSRAAVGESDSRLRRSGAVYSERSAVIGSTRSARSVGAMLPPTVIRTERAMALANAVASQGFTPASSASMLRPLR